MKLSKKIVAAAILLGIITTFGLYYYISLLQKKNNNIPYAAALVAKKNIPEGTKIDSSMMEIKNIDEKSVLKNALKSAEAAAGKYAAQQITEGEQILPGMVLDLEKMNFSYKVPVDKRAVTIAVDDVAGVAYLVKPGDYVDVLVFVSKYEVEDKYNKYIFPDIEKMMLQNIQVLAVDSGSSVEEKSSDNKEGSSQPKKKITLAVSPEEAEKLVLGDTGGKIRLALRNPEDKKTWDTTGAIRNDIVPDRGKTVLPNK